MMTFLAEAAEAVPVSRYLLMLVPWVLVGLIVYFFFFRLRKQEMDKVEVEFHRNQAHRDAVEQKLDRVIELLEERKID